MKKINSILRILSVILHLHLAIAEDSKNEYICQGETRTISCDEGEVIYIQQGYYGRPDEAVCFVEGKSTYTCSPESLTHRLIWEACEGKNECELSATDSAMLSTRCLSNIIGDFYLKYIHVEYRCNKPGKTVIGSCTGRNTWGEWISTDNPAMIGDVELLSHHRILKEGCADPTAIEIRLKEGGGDYHTSNDVLRMGIDYGVVCYNSRQAGDKMCSDYKIRYCCKGKATKRCKNPGRISHGISKTRPYFGVGEKLTYKCKNGYSMTGEAVLECKVGGVWSAATPKCQREVRQRGATCKAYGDPHYLQFDNKVRQDFMGKCTYRMSETCGLDVTDDRWFSVEVKNEVRKNNYAVSYVGYARVKFYGGDTELILEQKGVIKENGQVVTEIENDNYECKYNGKSTICKTVHGLRVMFNRNGIKIELSAAYKNQVCGICGNFNGDDTDDMITESGEDFSGDFKSFAESQETEPCDEVAGNFTCNKENSKNWEEKCKAITGNVFQDCQTYINPKPYFDACVCDQQATNGDIQELEEALSGYAQDCMEINILLCDWRKKTGAPRVRCPAHSRHRSCASPCQNTCSDPNAEKNCKDKARIETCVCNSGYLREGNRCVRRSQCGCKYMGYWLAQGEFFRKDATQCSCTGQNSYKCECIQGYHGDGTTCEKICHEPLVYTTCATSCPRTCEDLDADKKLCQLDCFPRKECVCPPDLVQISHDIVTCVKPDECPPGALIEQQKGRGRCKAFGDPHYLLFDSKTKYDFMGKCTYLMSETCKLKPFDERWFSVELKNEERFNRTEVSYVGYVILKLLGGDVEITMEQDYILKENGNPVLEIEKDTYRCHPRGSSLICSTDFGLRISFNSNGMLLHLDNSYKSEVCGICGNFNDDDSDDLVTSSGEPTDDFNVYAASYETVPCDKPIGNHSCGPDELKDWVGRCKWLIEGETFQQCRIYIESQSTYEACVFDQCATKGDQDDLDSSLTQYAQECLSIGVNVCDWRDKTGANAIKCPPHSTYDGCATPCANTCSDPLAAEKCKDVDLVETCVCDEGYLLEGTQCVEASRCGCSFMNYRLAQGSSFQVNDVTKCICTERDVISCICVVDGYYWDGTTCQQVPCDNLPSFDFASVSDPSRVYYPGDTAAYVCIEGYQSTADLGLICLQDRNWSGEIKCEKICEEPKVYASCATACPNTCQDPDAASKTCTRNCVTDIQCICPPYLVQVSDTDLSCIALDECVEKKEPCDNLPNFDFASVSSTATVYYPGDTAEYICMEGYQSTADSELTCLQDRSWSGEIRCEKICHEPFVYTTCATSCPRTCQDLDADKKLCQLDCFPRKECVCPPDLVQISHDIVTCVKPDECPPGALIEQQKGRGRCKAFGDPHYLLFDSKKKYDFMGKCTYLMSETCKLKPFDERWFSVELKNEERFNRTEVSYVGYVILKLLGGDVEITMEQDYILKENGNPVLEIEKDTYRCHPRGSSLICSTDFGLRISFNSNGMLLHLDNSYKSEVCGICGNFNDDDSDDLVTSSGEPTDDFNVYAASYETVPCDKPIGNHSCGPDELKDWVGRCKWLIEGETFQQCRIYIESQSTYEACVFDQCATKGDQDDLDSSLTQYAQECLSIGVNVCDWRDKTGANAIKCPPHSTYDGCATPCANTCSDPLAAEKCKDVDLVETCVCDEGYLLEGTQCVEASQCGCSFMNYRLAQGSSFQVNDVATCICTERDVISCICVVDGYYWDGTTCQQVPCDNLPSFDFASVSDPSRVYYPGDTAAYVCIEGYQSTADLELLCLQDRNWSGEIKCEKICEEPKVYAACATACPNTCQDPDAASKTCTRNCVTDIQCICPPYLVQVSDTDLSCIALDECVEKKDPCDNLPNFDYASVSSTATVYYPGDTAEYICMEGYQSTADSELTCLQDRSWSGEIRCEKLCQEPKVYTSCATACPNTCQDPDAASKKCTRNCVPDIQCICPPGLVQVSSTDLSCIALDECVEKKDPCDNLPNFDYASVSSTATVYYPGDTAEYICMEGYQSTSDSELTCLLDKSWSGKIRCEKLCQEPKVYTSCATACPNTCQEPDASKKCTRNCVPDIQCICPPGLVQVSDTVLDCIAEDECVPDDLISGRGGMCKVYGDPHYRLFDSKKRYDFMGKCTYLISETCKLDKTDDRWFSVELKNEERFNRTAVSYVGYVKLKLKGGDIEIIMEQDYILKFNGESVLEIEEDTYKCHPRGRSLVCSTTFGLRISFNSQGMTMNLIKSYKNQVCGICGNYNDDASDDLVTKDGVPTDDFVAYASSYETESCEEATGGGGCSDEEREAWVGRCKSLLDNEVFKVCRYYIEVQSYYESCVYDQCATKGDQNDLDAVMSEYAQDCQNIGIRVCDWREKTKSQQVKCPEHSSYEGCAPSCENTCFNPTALESCKSVFLMEACVCDPGYLRQGNGCVKDTECGCNRMGFGIAQGTSYQSNHATCTCVGYNKIECICNEGFMVDGEDCKPITCAPPPVPDYAIDVVDKALYNVNEMIVFSCISNYRLSGQDTLTCKSDGMWEGTVICEQICKGQEVYTSCATACPNTCQDPDAASKKCTRNCVPDIQCICPPGLVQVSSTNLSCIALDECVEEKEICKDPKVYTSCATACPNTCQDPDAASKKCTRNCVPDIQCICPPGLVQVSDTVLDCIAEDECVPDELISGRGGMCKVYGDPHYRLFDSKKRYDFMGKCTYLISETCKLDKTDDRWFSVELKNEERFNRTAVSYVGYVKLKLKGGDIEIIMEQDYILKFNGESVLEIEEDTYKCHPRGRSLVCSTTFGLRISFNSQGMTMNLVKSYKKQVCGICGNYNDDASDDLVTKDGVPTDDFVAYASSYETESCEEVTGGGGCSDEEREAWVGRCKSLLDNEVFKVCRYYIEVQSYYESCVYDQCATKGDQNDLDAVMSEYAQDCQNIGIRVCDWREKTKSQKVKCPEHSSYEGCAPSCENTCFNPTALKRCKSVFLMEACVCDPGYLRQGNECVKETECGCNRMGFGIEQGTSYQRNHTTCTCVGYNKLECICNEGFMVDGEDCIPMCKEPQIYTSCATSCPRTCKNKDADKNICTRDCLPDVQCVCPPHLVQVSKYESMCIDPDKCPPVSCDASQIYTLCATACPRTCQDPDADKKLCTRNCRPDVQCVCPPNLVQVSKSITACIALDECIPDEVIDDPCSSNPCKNRGGCMNLRNGNYRCICLTGYKGKNCELDPFCDLPPIKDFAYISEATPPFRAGDTVTYKCRENYKMISKPYLTCSPELTWEGKIECKKIECLWPELGMYAEVVSSKKTKYDIDEVFEYICIENYRYATTNSFICLSNGEWSGVVNCIAITCTPPPVPIFAIDVVDKAQYNVNEMIVFSCIFNYRLSGQDTLTCKSDGMWEGTVICEQMTCDAPPIVEFSEQMNFEEVYFVDDVVFITCIENYQIVGDSRLICLPDGTWSGQVVCEKITCDRPPGIEFAFIDDIAEEYYVNDRVIYICQGGYRLITESNTLTCTSQGTWFGEIACKSTCIEPKYFSPCGTACPETCASVFDPLLTGACTMNCVPGCICPVDMVLLEGVGSECVYAFECPIRCNEPPVPDFAVKLSGSSPYFVYATIVYGCVENYYLVGEDTFTCLSDSTWTGTVICEPIQCDEPPIAENSVISFARKFYYVGDIVVFECIQGYRSEGDIALSCSSDQTWIGEIICKRVECDPPSVALNSVIKSGGKPPYYANDEVEFECIVGYKLISGDTLTCTSDATWSGVIVCEAICTAPKVFLECGSGCQLSCMDRYDTSPRNCPAVCVPSCVCPSKMILKDGESGDCVEESKCPKMCYEPPIAEFSVKLSGTAPYAVGDVVRFTCEKNYMLTADSSLTCMSDESWRGTIVCEKIECKAPIVAENSVLLSGSEPFYAGDVVIFGCIDGYQLVSSSDTLECTSDAIWEGEVICERIQCAAPVDPNNSIIISGSEPYYVGDNVVFKCIVGYQLTSNSDTLTCASDKTWSGAIVCEGLCTPPTTFVECGSGCGPPTCMDRFEPLPRICPTVCLPGCICPSGMVFNNKASGECVNELECPEMCDEPPVAEFSVPMTSDGPYLVGDKVMFECEGNYILVADDSLTCVGDETWEGTITCERIQCAAPVDPNNSIIISGSEPYYVGDNVVFACIVGYQLTSNSDTLTCLSDETWSGAIVCEGLCTPPTTFLECGSGCGPPTCMDRFEPLPRICPTVCLPGCICPSGMVFKNKASGECVDELECPEMCDEPPVAEFSVPMSSDGPYLVGDKVMFECEENYILVADDSLTCVGDETWEGTITCEKIECKAPIVAENSVLLSGSEPFYAGDVVIFGCINGYQLVSSSDTLECTSDAIWEGEVICERIQCAAPVDPNNSIIISGSEPYYVGDNVVFKCIVGYQLTSNSDTLTCASDKTWSGAIVCEGLCTPPTTFVECGSGCGPPTCMDRFEPLPRICPTVCLPGCICPSGMVFNNKASGECVNELECPEMCDEPPVAEFSVPMSRDGPYLVGDKVMFECEGNYILVADDSLTCVGDETWEGTITCERMQCEQPPVADFSVILFENEPYYFNSKVTFGCEEGYQITSQSDTLTCSSGGIWDGEIVCELQTCPEPPTVDFAVATILQETYYFADVVTYECIEKYKSSADDRLTCQADGTWAGAVICQRIMCDIPPVADSSSILLGSEQYYVDDTVTFKCNDGYKRTSKSDTLTCSSNGIWIGVIVCELIFCVPPLEVTFAVPTTNDERYHVNDVIIIECIENYKLTADDRIKCLPDGTWGGLIVCEMITCGELPLISNGELTYMNDSKSVGSIGHHKCHTGYELQGSEYRTCQKDGTWDGIPATCVAKCKGPRVFSNCPSSCPQTCLDKFDLPPRACTTACVPGCVCPPGMIQEDRDSDVCVKRCPTRTLCKAWGDPHYIMFAKSSKYDFMGLCTYLMAEPTVLNRSNPRWFAVHGENDGRGRRDVSWVKNAKILLDGGATEIMLEKDGPKVNGVKTFEATGSSYVLSTSGNSYSVTTAYGVTISYNSNAVAVRLPTSYKAQMEGLCGDYNLDSSDDLMMANGEMAKDFHEFANSYQIGECDFRSEVSPVVPTCTEEDRAKWAANDKCGSMINNDGVFGECSDVMDVMTYYEGCIFDTCATQGLQEVLIGNLETFVAECQEFDVKVCNWREVLGLPKLNCQAHSTYNGCASSCTDTCNNPEASQGCEGPVVEACVCDEGYLLQGQECVLKENCASCYRDGLFIPKGEFNDERSHEACACEEDLSVSCVCMNGYIRDGNSCRKSKCQDNPCHTNAICTENEAGEAVCECGGRYIGDGYSCTGVTCNLVGDVPSANITYTNNPPMSDDVVTYTCEVGYVLRGDATRTCEADGQWSGITPNCEKIMCGFVARPAQGRAKYFFPAFYGEELTYECNEGYVLDGVKKRTCGANGKWSGSDSTCVLTGQITCPPPAAFENGNIAHNVPDYIVGKMLVYECRRGYRIEGIPVRICQSSGEWSAPAPFCVNRIR